MHGVILHLFGLDRTEGSQPNRQGKVKDLVPVALQTIQDLRREVQTGGGSGHCGPFALVGINGLVALLIRGVGGSADVGREGEGADPLSQSGWVRVWADRRK